MRTIAALAGLAASVAFAPALAQDAPKPVATPAKPAAKKAHRRASPEQIRRFNELQQRQGGKR